MGRSDKRPKETFIFYTTKEFTKRRDGIDIYTAEPKCMNYCPRCIEMMRRIETLFGNPPSDWEPDLREIFSCPPCTDLAHKFRKFIAEDDLLKREHDSELIHLQRLTSPSQDAISTARTRFEDLVMGGDKDNVPTKIERAKDNVPTKQERAKDNELTKKEREKEDLKTKATKTVEDTGRNKKKRDADDKDFKAKSTEAHKPLGKINKDAEKTIKGSDKVVSSSKVGNIDSTKTVKDTGRKKKERDADDKDLKAKSTEAQKSLGKISMDAEKTIKGSDKIVSSSKVGNIDSTKTVKDTGRKKKERDADDKDLKAKSTEAQKSLGKISMDAEKTIKGGDMMVNSSKVGNIGSKRKIEEKANIGKTLKSINSESAAKLESLSSGKNPLIRMKIADHMHEQTKQDQANQKHALQLLKKTKDIEDKLNRAKKLEEDAKNTRARAEEARQLKFKAAMQYDGPAGPGSVDRDTDVCSHESDETVVNCMIKGSKIVKARAEKQVAKPIAAAVLPSITSRSSVAPAHPPPTLNTDSKTPHPSSRSGHLRDAGLTYTLSERKYVDKGWTLLPKEKVMRHVTLFLMHPARNAFDWLEMNRHKEHVMYESGEQLATFDQNGCAKVYYRSGVLALDFYQAREKNAGGYRVVVYSNGKPVERGRAPLHLVLATFDYSGNGAVFDHNGQPRLKYSQNDGVVLDRSIGPYTHWKWHNLNDAGRLQTVLVENELINKDPKITRLGEVGERGKKVRNASQGDEKSADKSVSLPSRGSDKADPGQEIELGEPISNDDEINMRTIEAENVIKNNCRLLKGFSLYQIKMKAFKINDNISLRIIDQSTVFLAFSDGKTRLRINVGMVMDPTVVLGQDLVEVGEVMSSLEKMPASESLEELQRVVRGARAAERARVLREKRINPPVSHDSPLPSRVKDMSHTH